MVTASRRQPRADYWPVLTLQPAIDSTTYCHLFCKPARVYKEIHFVVIFLFMLCCTDVDELRQTLSLVHRILDTKQKALQEMCGESEVDSICLLQVCS